MMRYSLQQVGGLPEAVRDHIFDPQLADRYVSEIYPALDDAERSRISELLFDVYFRAVTPSAFLGSLRELLKDEKLYADVAPKILGYDFQGIADWLNVDIPALILQEGGDPNIYKKKVPASDVVAVIRRKSGVVVADDVLDRRLDKILASVALGGRKVDQLSEVLMGPVKTSGIGMDGDSAALVVAAAEEEMKALETRAIVVVPDESLPKDDSSDAAPAEAVPSGISSVMPAPAPVPAPKPTFQTVQFEDIKEVEALRKKIEPTGPVVADLDAFVGRAVQAAALPNQSPEMLNRFRMAAALYLRDLRDALETKSKFTSPVATGGLGLAETEGDRVMAALKGVRSEFEAVAAGQSAVDKDKFVAEQARRHLLQQERTDRIEKQDLDKRYQDLVQRSGIAMPKSAEPAQAPAPKAPSAPVTIPVISVPKTVPPPPKPEPVLPTLTAAPKPAAPTPDLRFPISPIKPPPPVPPALPTPPPTLQTPPSATAVPPTNLPMSGPTSLHVSGPGYVSVPQRPQPIVAPPSPQKPVVADVIASPRLTGPVDELRSITLTDFIRLSKEPQEATLKIKDKIDLLEERGFEVKQQGIKAWHDSEVNRLYLELLRTSLEGKPVNDVIAAREAAKQPTLTKPQFDAIMVLNRTLRFG